MSMSRNSIEKRCQGCRMHPLYCFCDQIDPLEINNYVSLIVHQKEFFLPSTTSYYTTKIIPQNSEILIRGIKDNPLILAESLMIKARPIVLFPSEDSVELNENWAELNPGPYHLIVPDGTWSQAKKVCKREPFLKDITKVHLNHDQRSQYFLRRAPSAEKLCTLESIIVALEILKEDKDKIDSMKRFFKIMINQNLLARKKKDLIV